MELQKQAIKDLIMAIAATYGLVDFRLASTFPFESNKSKDGKKEILHVMVERRITAKKSQERESTRKEEFGVLHLRKTTLSKRLSKV